MTGVQTCALPIYKLKLTPTYLGRESAKDANDYSKQLTGASLDELFKNGYKDIPKEIIPEPPPTPKGSHLKRIKGMIAAPLVVPATALQQQQVQEQMNPYVEAYEEKKKQLTNALARQLNIAGAAPEIEKPISQTLLMSADPLNYVPGGKTIGLLQAGAGLSPKSAEMKALEQAKIRARAGR